VVAFIRQWWKWMTSRPGDDRSLLSAVAWWERRRLSYNLFLAVVGIPSLLLFYLAVGAAHSLAPGEDAIEPIALMAAPIGANLAYTAGWVVEGALLAQDPTRPLGPRLMRAGLLFSLAVLFSPAILWTIIGLAGLVSRLSWLEPV
jgi:hypothetical protein